MSTEFERIVPENMFESADLKIIICYLLASINEPVPATETAQLFHYEGIANYFDTQTAIYELEKSGYIEPSISNKDLYVATPKGVSLSATLSNSVSSVLRTRVYNAVLKMLSRYKAERDTSIEITKTENGCLLTCSITNKDTVLFSFQIMLPNMLQAQALKQQILTDPKYYYDSFIKTLTDDIPTSYKS